MKNVFDWLGDVQIRQSTIVELSFKNYIKQFYNNKKICCDMIMKCITLH